MNHVHAASSGARALLGQVTQLRVRVLPPLDQIRRAVNAIHARWPDAVHIPENQDREKLALEMRHRVTTWEWEGVTTQRVNSAAVAVFDEDRCDRADLAPVRDFYITEIETREAGAFLDGMVGVYLDSFSPGSAHTDRLARALSLRSNDLGDRHRGLIEALPDLFRPETAPARLAQIMAEAEDAYTHLREVGLSRPHTSGLAKAAHPEFIKRLAPDLADTAARQKLLNWLTPTNGPALQFGAGPAVEALLAVWRDRSPPDSLRNELSETIIAAWRDPRLHTGGIWSGFDPALKGILLRWLTHQDMKFFCDMVTATQNSHMWPPRRDFWLKLYKDGVIEEAWVAFGSEAREYAKRNMLSGGRIDMNRRFGRQLDRGGSTSLLIMRIGNKLVVDGCHSYKTHIFRNDDPKAPKLYRADYYCDDIMRASRNSKPHISIYNWSQWVLQHV